MLFYTEFFRILNGSRYIGRIFIQFARHKIFIGHVERREYPVVFRGNIPCFRIICLASQDNGVSVSQFSCPFMALAYQGGSYSLSLILRQNGQRSQRQLDALPYPNFGKHDMARDPAVYFRDQG